MVTSNSVHFWAWSRNEAENYVKPYLGPEGVLIGDPHLRNVFDYRNHGEADLAVADIDDGGEGPLFLDIVRYVTYLESTDMDSKIGDVFEVYAKGLRGGRSEIPDLMSEAREEGIHDIQKKHRKYIRKHLKDGSLDLKELGLTAPSELNRGQKADWDYLSKIALQRTGEKEVLGGGYIVNDSGSSAGMSRYWILLGEENDPRLLIEFKELSRPAISYYQDQPSQEARVEKVVAAYTKGGFDESHFGTVKANGKYFWMRPRHYQALDLDEDKASESDRKDFSLYLANWMGLMQSKQREGAALSRLIEKDPRSAKEALEKMVRAYQKEMER
jgi:hypothetical protein